MKTGLKLSALTYEAPQAELLLIHVEQNLLATQSDTKGQNITWSDSEDDFDEFFK